VQNTAKLPNSHQYLAGSLDAHLDLFLEVTHCNPWSSASFLLASSDGSFALDLKPLSFKKMVLSADFSHAMVNELLV